MTKSEVLFRAAASEICCSWGSMILRLFRGLFLTVVAAAVETGEKFIM
jgi:hypothetical protein